MRRLVIFPGKIGDAIFATSSIRHLAKQNPGDTIDWVYGSPMLDEFTNDCLIYTDLPVRGYMPFGAHYGGAGIHGTEWRGIDWKDLYPGYDHYHNLSIGSFPEPGCHLIEWIGRIGGIIKRGDMLPNPYFNFQTHSVFEEYGNILVHPWIPPVERQWYELMKLAPKYGGYTVGSIGHPNEQMVPGTDDMRGIDYRLYISHLRTAKLVVGLASSPVVLAATFGVPTIMVHRITSPLNVGVGRFGPQNIDLVQPSVYNIEQAIDDLLGLQSSDGRRNGAFPLS